MGLYEGYSQRYAQHLYEGHSQRYADLRATAPSGYRSVYIDLVSIKYSEDYCERNFLDYKAFKEKYKKLAREIELDTSKTVHITSYRSNTDTGEAAVSSHNLTGYMPDVIDFVRRCETKEEAKEIIEYLQKKGEISPQYARRLLKQLEKNGVRSFGSKKRPGYYEQFRSYEPKYYDY